MLTEISRAKDAGITPEQYLARAQATHNPRSIRIGEGVPDLLAAPVPPGR
ncbi:MAG: hypothetical protein ACLTG4_06365 [Oscillospiraceae bacterium]